METIESHECAGSICDYCKKLNEIRMKYGFGKLIRGSGTYGGVDFGKDIFHNA